MTLEYQKRRDALRRELLASNPDARREAIIAFILGCSKLASDLRSFSDHRHVDGYLIHIETQISEAFQRQFGHPLFQGVNDED